MDHSHERSGVGMSDSECSGRRGRRFSRVSWLYRYAMPTTPRVSKNSAETELRYYLLIDCTNFSGKIGQSLSSVRVKRAQKSIISISASNYVPNRQNALETASKPHL